MDAKTLLTGVVLKQAGKVVEGEPVKDNYAVYPKAGSPLAAVSGAEILKTLRAAYPQCVFTYCIRPVDAKGK